MNRIHSQSGIQRRPFSCKRGSLTIRGHVFRKGNGILPAIIICHGFMANQHSVWHYAKLAADLGWAAFTFDFCGGCLQGTSDGKQSEMSVLTEVQDLKAVMEYVSQRDDVDSSRISLMGCSQGGVVCALTAAEMPDGIERLILFFPAFCIPDDARRGRMMFAKFDPCNIPHVISRFPMKLGGIYAKDVINMNIYDEIRGYDGPVLLVHGTKDEIVDISYSRKAKEIYKQCEYVEIDGAGHIFSKNHDCIAMEALEKFLVREF